jgi:hypothetical protein
VVSRPPRVSGTRYGVFGRSGAAASVAAALVLAACGNSDVRIYPGPEATPQSIELAATAVGQDQAVLNWTSAGTGLAYQVQRNGVSIATATDLQFVDRGLAAGQRFCWRVLAYGGFGWQARSNEACLGTAPDTTAWRYERIATGRWPTIAVDPSGNLHACFITPGSGVRYLQVAPGREPEAVDADGAGQCSVAVDTTGVVRIAYLSPTGLRHAVRESGRWTASTVDVAARIGVLRTDGPALAIDADGQSRIAYRRLTADGGSAIAVATRVEAGWRFETTGIQALVGPRSLAVEGDGTVWLATVDELGQAAIAWARRVEGWRAETSIVLAPNGGSGPPLLLTAAAAPAFAAFQRNVSSVDARVVLRFAERAAAGWRTTDLESFAAAGERIALSAWTGEPRVALVEAGGRLRAWTRAEGVWSDQSPRDVTDASGALDLVTGTDGQWHIVYDRLLEGGVWLASRAP